MSLFRPACANRRVFSGLLHLPVSEENTAVVTQKIRQRDDLIIQQYKFFSNPFVGVIVPEKPSLETAQFFDTVEIIGQAIVPVKAPADNILQRRRSAVRKDAVHLILVFFEIAQSLLLLFFRRQLFRPPRNMIDAVHRPFPVKFFAFGNKIRIVRLENTGVNIVGGRAAEREEAHAVDLKTCPRIR